MSEHPKKYPDEDVIEKILDQVHDVAWNDLILDKDQENKLLEDLRWVLDIWNKQYLGHDQLTKIVSQNYLSVLPTCGDKSRICKELDLVICFFQHYIYAFEEFMTRGFRDSVIRCGLVCERLVKRLAVADGHREVLKIFRFEDRANKVMSLLSGRVNDIQFLISRMKYIYSKRTERGAHDTGAARILIAKSCISEIPITYMEYLNALEKLGHKIGPKNELIELVNETVSIRTTMIVIRPGEPTDPESILTTMFSQNYFAQPRSFAEITAAVVNQEFNIPKTTLWQALKNLCAKKILTRSGHGIYVQRTPPEKYYNKEITK